MRRPVSLAVTVAAVAVVVALVRSRGLPVPPPRPPGTFAFATLGDAPYDFSEELRYRFVRTALAADDLAFVLHVGDIFWHPCSDAHYHKTLDEFTRLPHPVVYTPGDNEWTDCWEQGSGAFAPRERLQRIREMFFRSPQRSLGGRVLALTTQGGSPEFPEFVENARWTVQGLVFATVHLVGSGNGLRAFPGRTGDDDLEVQRRTAAAADWLRQAFAAARATDAAALVVAFHGEPSFAGPPEGPERKPYQPFLSALAEEVAQFPRPVLLIHGDGHEYTVDHPLLRPGGAPFENFTRLEVPGSPDVGWVRVVVAPQAAAPFTFEEYIVASWKLW